MAQQTYGAAKTQAEIKREQQGRQQQNQENQQVFSTADQGGAGSAKTDAEKNREQQLTQSARQQYEENKAAFAQAEQKRNQ
ncbi:MAG: hypothetical protein D9V47_02375 [Clostridia bacterium]|nr:MAG: hypothetical protein D9V47_02375 [Clostridia bacterium]